MYSKQARSLLAELGPEQTTYRDLAIAKVRDLAAELGLSQVIVSTTYTYFDILLQKLGFELNEGDYHNYMLACFMIATKFHEGCQANPKSGVLAKFLKNLLEETGMRVLELKIAEYLEWNFDIQTPTQFISYFMARGTKR